MSDENTLQVSTGGYEVVRDGDGNFVEWHNPNARPPSDGSYWDDEKQDFIEPSFDGFNDDSSDDDEDEDW